MRAPVPAASSAGSAPVAPPIAVIQGARSADIQRLLAAFVAGWQGRIRIAGLVEEAQADVCKCAPGRVHLIGEDRRVPIFQELGPGAESCSLDPYALVAAGEAVRARIAAGCDLVVLSKFGKLEAESRSGLLPAFADAIEAGIPVLTSVAPKFQTRWAEFAAPYFAVLPPDLPAIEAWWAAQPAA